jgi:hypothetical protein
MKQITMHHSLARALSLLRLVNRAGKVEATAACWDNGREQGLALEVFGNNGARGTVFIAETRSSDQTIVVTDPSPQPFSNKPSEEAWSVGRKYFEPKQEAETVRYIIQQLKMLHSLERGTPVK